MLKSKLLRATQEDTNREMGSEDEVKFDPRYGVGAVPFNEEVGYLGFVVNMTPDEFLKLNPTRNENPSNYLREHKVFGNPILSVKWDAEYSVWEVWDHEGRARMMVTREHNPNQKVPVHMLPKSMKNKDLTEAMLKAPIVSDSRADHYYVFTQE